jgi:hypothetical protein
MKKRHFVSCREHHPNHENVLSIEILDLEQVWWHRSCKYFWGKNTSYVKDWPNDKFIIKLLNGTTAGPIIYLRHSHNGVPLLAKHDSHDCSEASF